MTLRERILAVYRGECPDVLPMMLDLSHWFYHRYRRPWDLSRPYLDAEYDLIDYHRRAGVGFYMPNLAAFYETVYAPEVHADVVKSADEQEITWSFETPRGLIRRTRRWENQTYAWGIPAWGIHTESDLRVLGDALEGCTFTPRWDRYRAWLDYTGETGVVYLPAGYSALGQLMHYWMGVERCIYAAIEWNRLMHETIERINAANLRLIDLLADSPAEIVILGDNFSSDIQPPYFFDEWSRPYYTEAIRRLKKAGKYVAVHIDGRLRHYLRIFVELGADCADAVTPAPMGDLDPDQCRAEAGPGLILSGGIPPDLWLSEAPLEAFTASAKRWLGLRRKSPRLILNAGDQVPPGAEESRIALLRDLAETEGRY